MATLVLSAAGTALGGSLGGSFLGLSAATLGRAAGAAIGRRIDQRIFGSGSAPVEVGRVDRFRLTGASEGAATTQIYGRMRVAGQVIWATRFNESSETTGGGKGGPPQPKTTTFSYSVSMAVALCRGQITRVGRVWADGEEVAPDTLNMRVYFGDETQGPDPKIEAVEGVGHVPAYRGMAYVVMEDLPLGPFGNRVPQFSFEVFRPAEKQTPEKAEDLAHLVTAVAMIPGSGDYALATSPVFLSPEFGAQVAVNSNSPSGKTDMLASIEALTEEMPQVGSVSLVVSWFGDDLRCGSCQVKPKAEFGDLDSEQMPWRVNGISREQAEVVSQVDGRPVYGGTPADASVIEAIIALKNAGQSVVYYPFILMDQLPGNSLPDPYTAQAGQPKLPWRGRITTSLAPDVTGSTDGTSAADVEVAAFVGTAQVGDFLRGDQGVSYTGPNEWSFRRYVLHQAHLCVAAGGVDAFCIGSELRGLTQIRGAGGRFPFVEALSDLAADVRQIVGPDCKISYAADWSEYHGYQPRGTADKVFHLDALWGDPNVDFIGIDNYMPLSDWRDGEVHADVAAGSIYNLDYLTANVAGGEGYDWFYASTADRASQQRSPITDGLGEPWIYRYKDIQNWWSQPHHDRIDGIRSAQPTAWVPQSKPIWFTEIGCAAIDKGTNQPNKFLDPKSSESTRPYFSNGYRDDYIQMQYLRALHRHYADPSVNPVSSVYDGPMVDMARAHVWAWDARPFPQFPGLDAVWSDGGNYDKGHWLNGRTTSRSLASVVAQICATSGVFEIDTDALHGLVRGYQFSDTDTARQAIQPLMLTYGFDAHERDGVLVFKTRNGWVDHVVDPEWLAVSGDEPALDLSRASEAEVSGRVQLSYVEAEGHYAVRAAEAVHAGDAQNAVHGNDVPLALTAAEGQIAPERWLAEARVARDTARFALPLSRRDIGPGDVVALANTLHRYRVDRVEITQMSAIDAVRVEPETYAPHGDSETASIALRSAPAVIPVEALFMDLPILSSRDDANALRIAAAARPWPGTVAAYVSTTSDDVSLATLIDRPAIMGVTQTPLLSVESGRWDRGGDLIIKLIDGALSGQPDNNVLSGKNVAVIGDGSADRWEVIQFSQAELIAPRTYAIRRRLRGQAGTDTTAPFGWPTGSRFVLMTNAVASTQLPNASRDAEVQFRVGPASRAFDDPTYRRHDVSLSGAGYRPYPVAHLRSKRTATGLDLSWVRRTRIDGDGWSASEVPVGENQERYAVRVVAEDGVVLRSSEVSTAMWGYTDAMRAADGPDAWSVEVAQVSDRYGAGPYRALPLSAL